MSKRVKKTLAIICCWAMLFSLVPASASGGSDSDGSAGLGVPTLVWDSTTDSALTALSDGDELSAIGQMSTGGNAVLTALKDVEVKSMYDLVDWTVPTAIQVGRGAAADGLLLDPDALELLDGVSYIWEIEGVRSTGDHRAAFGTVSGNTTAINGGAATHSGVTAQSGYFTIKRTITHSDSIDEYRVYGVGRTNTTAAAGDLTIFKIKVSELNPGTLYYEDFSGGNPGTVNKGAGEQTKHEVIADTTDESNNVLRTKVEGPGYAGFDIKDLGVAAGSQVRVSTRVRRVAANDGYTGTSTFRICSGVNGTVANWEFARDRKAIGTAWTDYTVTAQLPVGTDIFALQFCKDTEAYAGEFEFDFVKVEILEAPANAAIATWEDSDSIPSISEAYKSLFLVGNILDSVPEPGSAFEQMFLHQYNAVTTENAMKPGGMSPSKGVYTFDHADAIVDWANANDLYFVGHALLWHSQTASWLHTNENNQALTYAEGNQNLKDFITTVAGHYEEKGVDAWDVLNEIYTSNGGSGNWKSNLRQAGQGGDQSKWRAVYTNQAPAGVNHWDFVYDALMYARKAAPSATLRYNDFNDEAQPKARNMRDMANEINAIWATDTVNNPEAKADYGTPFTGASAPTAAQLKQNTDIVEAYLNDGGRLLLEVLGLQSHYGEARTVYGSGDWKMANAFPIYLEAVGVKLHVTELDYGDNATSFNTNRQRQNFNDLFNLYIDNADRLDVVTFWGPNDVQSWRSSNNPTLFTRPTANDPVFRAKPAFYDIIGLVINPAIALPKPVTGEIPVTSVETEQYTAAVTWSPAVNGTFACGVEYTASIEITLKNETGLTFDDVRKNYFTVAGADIVINDAKSGIVTAVFPATLIPITAVIISNNQANVDFSIRSANGKGYTVYISETRDGPFKPAKANFNSKGVHIKDLTKGKTYYIYVEYQNGDVCERTDIIVLQPGK